MNEKTPTTDQPLRWGRYVSSSGDPVESSC